MSEIRDLRAFRAVCMRELSGELKGKRSSAWDHAVNLYAMDLLESVFDRAVFENRLPSEVREFEIWALNGAASWMEYSYGGNGLICDQDIAERVCTPSAYKRSNCGRRNPNKRETWLDVQARALRRAYVRAELAYKRAINQK